MRIPRRPQIKAVLVPALIAVSAVQVTPSLGSATNRTLPPLLSMTLLAVVVTVVMAVIGTAVWSKKKTRRDAALAVLDRIFGRRPER